MKVIKRKPSQEISKPKKKALTLSERNFGYFQKTDQITTIYIGNLRYTEDEKSIKKMFEKFGQVSYIRVIFNRETKSSTGVAFVQMTKLSDAKKSIEYYDQRDFHGRVLKVSIALDNQKPTKQRKVKTYAEIKVNKEKEEQEKLNFEKQMFKKKQPRSGLKVLFNYQQS